MIEWIKSLYKRYRKTIKQNKSNSNLYNAKKHAIIALAYWKHCEGESDLHFQIEKSNIYVRLGK